MAPNPPTLHTFDPLIAGKLGMYVDLPASYDMVIIKVGAHTGGPYNNAVTLTKQSHNDALYAIFDADTTVQYYIAQAHDSTGYSNVSNEIAAACSAGPPPPPPPLTAQQHLEAALNTTLQAGDQIALYAQPSTVETLQADGSLT